MTAAVPKDMQITYESIHALFNLFMCIQPLLIVNKKTTGPIERLLLGRLSYCFCFG